MVDANNHRRIYVGRGYFMESPVKFQIDYGTKLSTSELDIIQVSIDPKIILNDYAKATLVEMQRMNPEKFATLNLTHEALQSYFSYLVKKRVESVRGELKEWRQIRNLFMPAWVQFAISCVGEVIVQEFGLKFVPIMDSSVTILGLSTDDFTLQDAFIVSDILRSFKVDGLSVLDDGFPRSREGQKDTMTLSLIGGYVKGIWPVSHPIFTYVAAFLGLKILESQTFDNLYRCRYDEVNFISTMLLHDERILR